MARRPRGWAGVLPSEPPPGRHETARRVSPQEPVPARRPQSTRRHRAPAGSPPGRARRSDAAAVVDSARGGSGAVTSHLGQLGLDGFDRCGLVLAALGASRLELHGSSLAGSMFTGSRSIEAGIAVSTLRARLLGQRRDRRIALCHLGLPHTVKPGDSAFSCDRPQEFSMARLRPSGVPRRCGIRPVRSSRPRDARSSPSTGFRGLP